MGIKITGFDDLSKNLKNLKKNIAQVGGVHNVSFDELFNTEFMRKNTSYETIDEMFEFSGFKLESNADFEAIPISELDSLVSRTTRFKNWEEMKSRAGAEYGVKLLEISIDKSF